MSAQLGVAMLSQVTCIMDHPLWLDLRKCVRIYRTKRSGFSIYMRFGIHCRTLQKIGLSVTALVELDIRCPVCFAFFCPFQFRIRKEGSNEIELVFTCVPCRRQNASSLLQNLRGRLVADIEGGPSSFPLLLHPIWPQLQGRLRCYARTGNRGVGRVTVSQRRTDAEMKTPDKPLKLLVTAKLFTTYIMCLCCNREYCPFVQMAGGMIQVFVTCDDCIENNRNQSALAQHLRRTLVAAIDKKETN